MCMIGCRICSARQNISRLLLVADQVNHVGNAEQCSSVSVCSTPEIGQVAVMIIRGETVDDKEIIFSTKYPRASQEIANWCTE